MKVVANIYFDIEAVDVYGEAKTYLKSILPENIKFKIREPRNRLILGEFSLNDVFDNLTDSNKLVPYQIDDKEFLVNLNTKRYITFKNNKKCVSCGLEGIKFFLEKYPDTHICHFKLYGLEDDKWIPLTRDHIIPRSKGGNNNDENYATMCRTCNTLKGDLLLSPNQVKELKDILDNNSTLTKKALNKLLFEAKEEMLNSEVNLIK